MSDRREEILSMVFNKYKEDHPADNWATFDQVKADATAEITYSVMDEYMKETCLELLDYMIKKQAVAWVMVDKNGHEVIGFSIDKGHFVTKEQLFENFL